MRGMFNAELGMNPTKWIPQHAKSNYKKDSEKSERLNNALYCWRKKEFAQWFPDHVNSMWIGDWIVLGDDIIDDIIYLAHTNKLSDPAKFIQLVDWEDREHYASEILPIKHSIFPPPLPVQPNRPTSHAGDLKGALMPKAICKTQCTNCKQMGHNSMLPQCSFQAIVDLQCLVRTCKEPCVQCGAQGHASESVQYL